MQTAAFTPLTPEQQKWVEVTFQSLTTREKIGQTSQERLCLIAADGEDALAEYLSTYPLGSLFGGREIIKGDENSAQAILELRNRCNQLLKVPLLNAGDLENGAGGAVDGMTAFPQLMALGATADEELAYEYGKYTALEGRAAGFTWTLAPLVDLLQNWLNSNLSNRSLGDDPAAVSELAVALIRGMQDHGLCACAKTFPGDGVDFRDQHLVTSVNPLTKEEWWTNHGAVFSATINAGVYSIMSAHIALPWRELLPPHQRRPRPATVSKRILVDLLRHEMGFRGVVVSDALEMAGFTGWAPYAPRMIEAFNAGNDVMLWPGERYFEVMHRALEEGLCTMERLDESVRRILELKARMGLNEIDAEGRDPRALPLNQGRIEITLEKEAQALAQKVAESSLTLVRNEKGVLPLAPRKIRRVLLHFAINPTSNWRTNAADLFKAELEARGIEVTLLENGNCLDVWNLEKEGERWDAYLVVFDLQMHHVKNTVRPVGPAAEVMWTLQNTDTLKPIVISLNTPYLLWEMPFLDTLVNAYSPSPGTIRALTKALFGEIPFTSNSPVRTGGEWTWSTPSIPGITLP